MALDEEMRRLYWHSRRGMLELDLILLPFVEERLPGLEPRYRQLYRELLAQEDQDLYVWLMRRERPPSESLRAMVDCIVGG